MKRMMLGIVAMAAVVAMLPTPARASDPFVLFDGCKWHFPSLREGWQKMQCWCCDDYCSKPLPCVPCNARGTCDDYCGKPLPCVPCNARGTCDDYCPKTAPILLRDNNVPGYTCSSMAQPR